MNKPKNDFKNRKALAPIIILAVIALLIFTPALEIIVGLIGGAIGLIVGLVAGIFGLVVGLIGGAIGIVFGTLGAILGLVFGLLPLILVAWLIVMLVRRGQAQRTVDLPKQKNDFV